MNTTRASIDMVGIVKGLYLVLNLIFTNLWATPPTRMPKTSREMRASKDDCLSKVTAAEGFYTDSAKFYDASIFQN